MRSALGLVDVPDTGEVVVKKTLRTMMLAAAGVLGSVAVAQAQQPPPPAPGQPAQPGQPAPPPAEFGVAPAALPAAPVANQPVPTVNFGNQPPADSTTAAPADPPKKANPFLLTRLNWTNTASASIFGIGKDYQSSDGQSYTMDFSLTVRYAPIANSTQRFFVQTNIAWGAELTNSDTSTKRNEWQFRDMSIGTGYQHKVYSNADGVSTTPFVSANVILPTSKQSQGTGRYATTSLSAGIQQALPLNSKSDWLSDIFVIGLAGWSHLFSKSLTAVNDTIGVQRPRMDPTGSAVFNDQLSGSSLARNNARFLAAAYLTVYKDLSLNLSTEFLLPVKSAFSEIPCVQLQTGCVALPESQTALNPITTFDVGISYTLFNMTRIDLGYQHQTAQLDGGNKGQRRSFFYGPDAAFYTNVSVFIDSILDKAFNLTGGPTARRAAKAAAQHDAF
ncbi:MAG: hypothetical protein QM820_64055 [Minicystis sp.]